MAHHSKATPAQVKDFQARLNGFMARTSLSVTDVARVTGMTWPGLHYLRTGRRRPNPESLATLTRFMDEYERSNPPEKIERDEFGHNQIETESTERCEKPEHFLMTTSAKVVVSALDYCARRRVNGAIFADPGFGKSEAACYWSATTKYEHAMVFCRAVTCYSKLMRSIGRAVGLDSWSTIGDLDEALHDELARRPRLLVIDEADMLNARSLDWLRSLWDESRKRTCFLLLAKPAFYQRLQVAHARSRQDLRQVWRRLAFRKFLSGITEPEMIEYLKMRGLADGLEPEAVTALYAACGGSFGDLDMLIEIITQVLEENPRLHGRITAAVVDRARELRFGAGLVKPGRAR